MKINLKEIFKKSKFTFIMSIVTLVIALLSLLFCLGFSLKVKFIILLISLVPFICYLILTIINYKFYNKKSVKIITLIINILISISLIGYYIFELFLIAFIEAINPCTNPLYYSYYANDYLPKTIPKTAENVKFIYYPAAFQGGEGLSLYYIDKTVSEKEFDELYKNKSKWVGYYNDYKENNPLIGAFINTPIKVNDKNKFKIYLLHSECDNSGYCNHGTYSFVSINDKTHEVIIESEHW